VRATPLRFVLWLFLIGGLLPGSLAAQEPPPRIGPFAIDLHGSVPLFKRNEQLANSRGLLVSELPGRGTGIDAGAHLYLFTWKALTVGIGGQLMLGRSHASPSATSSLRPVTERFFAATPQLSLNFGDGDGWSYLSGGIGAATWSIVPDGAPAAAADQERLRTINYGGGARWFARPHLAFSVDVRFHQIDPGTPRAFRPGSPRTTFIAIGAGASVR
jgi:hypothetical protein